jgi:hypothetical protein
VQWVRRARSVSVSYRNVEIAVRAKHDPTAPVPVIAPRSKKSLTLRIQQRFFRVDRPEAGEPDTVVAVFSELVRDITPRLLWIVWMKLDSERLIELRMDL